jgi:hypothetical protein
MEPKFPCDNNMIENIRNKSIKDYENESIEKEKNKIKKIKGGK